jgi:hypothetical protein
MKDPHPYVRDTTAWTIGRVFEFQHDASDANIPELITRETLPQVAPVRAGLDPAQQSRHCYGTAWHAWLSHCSA